METLKQEWIIRLGYSDDAAEELAKLARICTVKLSDSSSATGSLTYQDIQEIIFNKFNECKHENVKLCFNNEVENLLRLKER